MCFPPKVTTFANNNGTLWTDPWCKLTCLFQGPKQEAGGFGREGMRMEKSRLEKSF